MQQTIHITSWAKIDCRMEIEITVESQTNVSFLNYKKKLTGYKNQHSSTRLYKGHLTCKKREKTLTKHFSQVHSTKSTKTTNKPPLLIFILNNNIWKVYKKS